MNGQTDKTDKYMKFAPTQVQQAAEIIASLPVTDRVQHEQRLSEFKFRHDNGSWWYCWPQDQSWYRHVRDQWIPAEKPADRLLGRVWVSDLIELAGQLPEKIDFLLPPIEEIEPTSSIDRLTAIASAVAEVQNDFVTGEINTEIAAAILRKYYLLDEQWRLWTVGVQSGQWYQLADDGWQALPAGPTGFPPSDEPNGVALAIQAQGPILSGRVAELPEPVMSRWNPPQGLPGGASDRLQSTDKLATVTSSHLIPTSAKPPRNRQTSPIPEFAPTSPTSLDLNRSHSRKSLLWLVAIGVLLVLVGVSIPLAIYLQDSVFVSAETMYWRGQSYRQGLYTPKNSKQALYWLRRAAAQDHAGALFALGEMYRDADGVARDFGQGRLFFESAAVQGHEDAMNALAQIYANGLGVEPDMVQAAYWRTRAAEPARLNLSD